jgi:hypothetical protein
MDNQLSAQDMQFLQWLDSKDGEQYWEKEENGEKVITRSSWLKAHMEYQKGLKENSKK